MQRLYLFWLAKKEGFSLSYKNNYIFIQKNNKQIILNKSHLAYAHDCILFFDYYHGAVKCYEKNSTEIVDYSASKEHCILKNNMVFKFSALPESIEGSLYVEYTKLKPGELVFDIGAYCGLSAHYLAQAVTNTGKVVCFEADPENYNNLLFNIQKHNMKNIVAVNKAIWKETATIQFNSEGNLGGHVKGKTSRNVKCQNVLALSLYDAIKQYGLPDVIKLDIEGAETDVIISIDSLLKDIKTRFIIEPHLMRNGTLTSEIMIPIFEKNGYTIEILQQGDFSLPLLYAYKK